jgi:hypothetical protein
VKGNKELQEIWVWLQGFKSAQGGKEAGWVAAIVLICVATFVVSSILARRTYRQPV